MSTHAINYCRTSDSARSISIRSVDEDILCVRIRHVASDAADPADGYWSVGVGSHRAVGSVAIDESRIPAVTRDWTNVNSTRNVCVGDAKVLDDTEACGEKPDIGSGRPRYMQSVDAVTKPSKFLH